MLHMKCHCTRIRNKQYLVFENTYGCGDLISESELEQILTDYESKVDLLFLAANDSEAIGKVFQNCGVQYTVCVEEECSVDDEVLISFAQNFYKEVFAGVKLYESFVRAKAATTSFFSKNKQRLQQVKKIKLL